MDVEYPEFGTIVIDGTRYDHDVVIEAGAVRARDKGPSRDDKAKYGHTPLTPREAMPWGPTQVLVGTGASGRLPITDEMRDAAADRGVEILAMPTAEAADRLASADERDVYAVLHVTC